MDQQVPGGEYMENFYNDNLTTKFEIMKTY